MASLARHAHDFRLNPRPLVSLQRVGDEQEPVLIVEDVLQDAGQLVDYATWEVAFLPAGNPGGGYPGLRAPAPLNYVENVVRALSPIIEQALGLGRVKLSRAECSFSLTTMPPEQLVVTQRIPHIDTTYPLQFAMLHYLCDPRFGGTAFYRHRATGFETIDDDRAPIYDAQRRTEAEQAPPPHAYVAGDTAHYVRTGGCEAKFNRLVVYRSRLLHSGQIAPDAELVPSPGRGRLTANIFINYRAA